MKCGNYWQDEHYGPIHVKLESQTGGEDLKPEGVTGFDFGVASQQSNDTTAKENIIRRFRLTRDDKADERPRHLVQIQCTAWPDFDVPETPDILLNLLHDVDEASSQTCVVDDVNDRAHHPPVLVHCESWMPLGWVRNADVRLCGCGKDRNVYHCRCHPRRPSPRPTKGFRSSLQSRTIQLSCSS